MVQELLLSQARVPSLSNEQHSLPLPHAWPSAYLQLKGRIRQLLLLPDSKTLLPVGFREVVIKGTKSLLSSLGLSGHPSIIF